MKANEVTEVLLMEDQNQIVNGNLRWEEYVKFVYICI